MSVGKRGDSETQSGRRGISKVENRNSEAEPSSVFDFRFSLFGYGVSARTLLLCAALALPGYFAARHLALWPDRLRYPGEVEILEGRVLADMTLLREGEPVYAPATPGKFCSMIYGPLYYLLGSRLIDPHEPAYRPLRMLAMFATLGLAGACGLLAWWVSKSYAATALSALMFLGFGLSTTYGVSARPDSVALLLWFTGFLIAYRFRESNKTLWSIPLLTLGAYYKQQFIVAPLAVFLFLVLEKRYRTALQFAALLGAAGLSLLAAFEFLVFRPQAFLLHFLSYNLLPFDWAQGLARLAADASTFLIPCILAAWSLLSRPDKLLACYFSWAVVLFPLLGSKRGAAPNYGFELILAACPLAARLIVSKLDRARQAVPLICLLAGALWLGRATAARGLVHIIVGSSPTSQDFYEDRAVQAFLRGTLPAGTPALGIVTGDLLRAGLSTPYTDLYQYSWLVCQGKLENESLAAQVRQRRFGVILLTDDLTSESGAHNPWGMCLPEPLHQAILQNYRLARTFRFQVWELRRYYAWAPR